MNPLPECGCGCCAGVRAATPRRVDNRPGLPAIAYRAGRHPDFRASLLAGLTRADRPSLAGLRTRDPADLSIALLDGFATVCDIITFYTERLAQESFLRTATDRVSLGALGRLVSYRLRPGVAAQTYLAFFVEPPPEPPPVSGPAAEAVAAFPTPTMSGAVTIDAGLPVRSIPGPGEQPQTFETVQPVDARAAWNALRALRTRQTAIDADLPGAYFAGITYNFRAGDRLLVSSTTGPGGAFTVVTIITATVDANAGTTHVTWSPNLPASGVPASPAFWALRPAMSVFGHNAPLMSLISAKPDPSGSDWTINASAAPNSVDVDGSHPEIVTGCRILLATGTTAMLYQVAGAQEMSRTAYAVSGRITRVALGTSTSAFDGHGRETSVSVTTTVDPLPLAPEPDPTAVTGGSVTVSGDVGGMAAGRQVIVAGTATTGGPAAEVATLDSAYGSTLYFAPHLTGSYRRDTVVVYGNIAPATHGETVHQLLGGGDASRPDQTFELAHAPLTYTRSTNADGAASTLRVRVNDVEWHEVPTLYPAGPTDRSFVTRVTEAGAVEVATGDGVRGLRPPTGGQNIRAIYRKGIGAAGNVVGGSLSQVMEPPLGLTRVTNPMPATGGADPQTPADARAGIPLSVRTLGRVVSLDDYADYARGYAGIAKAHAAVLVLPAGRTIVVTVAGAGGAVVPGTVRANLVSSLRDHGDPRVAVAVVAHRPVTFAVDLTLTTDPDHDPAVVDAAMRAALLAAFDFDARDFVVPVHRSELVAVVHRVPGVIACDINLFLRTSVPDPAEPGWPAWSILAERLFAARPTMSNGQPVGAELLSIDPNAFTWAETI